LEKKNELWKRLDNFFTMTSTNAVLDIQNLEAALKTELQNIKPDRFELLRLAYKTECGVTTVKKYLKGEITKLHIATNIIKAWNEIREGESRLAS
jgi:hypothetical protein